MDEDFQDIPISDVTVTFDLREIDGRIGIASGIEYSLPLPLSIYAIWVGGAGIPVGVADLGGVPSPPPYRDCFQVLLATDQRSMWGRKCPHCKSYWRTVAPGLASNCTCCYCGKRSGPHECLSDAQQAYVDVCCDFREHVLEQKNQGRYKAITHELLAMASEAEAGDPAARPEFFIEKQRQNRFTCEACGNVNDILGRFAYCSSCGTRNDSAILRDDLDKLKAHLQADGNATTALKESVDLFDSVGRNLARQLVAHVPMTKGRRAKWEKANFQQLEVVAGNLKEDFDIDIIGGISAADRAEVELRLHRRHLHAHRGGIVDEKYIADSGDTNVQVGMHVSERKEQILPFIARLRMLGDNFIRGFHAVIPTQEAPIRFHREREAARRKRTENDAKSRESPAGAAQVTDESLPNISDSELDIPDFAKLLPTRTINHPPRILLLYGSLRERSYSRLLTLEAERLLQRFGAETRVFDPRDLPLADSVPTDHPKVAELRALSLWSEGQVWCSPERHGNITGVFKNQVDWLPLELRGVRPTQGRTLAVMQVSGGSQSFNSVNSLRILGRWMRMVTIPNQSSVPKAYEEFDEDGRMKPSPLYDRVVDVMEELVKFTLMLRGSTDYLTDRYSERKERADKERLADLAFLSGAATN